MASRPHSSPFLPRACLISLLVHAVAATIFANFSRLTVAVSPVKSRLLGTLAIREIGGLHNKKSELSQPVQVFAGSKSPPRERGLKLSVRDKNAARATPDQIVAQSDIERGPNGSSRGSESIQPIVPADNGRLRDGLQEYRLNLARVARSSNRYPVSAKENAREGIVFVVVNSGEGGRPPLVSLEHSSGHQVLDNHALELLSQAVGVASLPEALRGQRFAFIFPVHFLLSD